VRLWHGLTLFDRASQKVDFLGKFRPKIELFAGNPSNIACFYTSGMIMEFNDC
jgi:hypothetical protein